MGYQELPSNYLRAPDAEFCLSKSNCSFNTIALRYILCLYHKVLRCNISNGTFTLNSQTFLSNSPRNVVFLCVCIDVDRLTNYNTMCLLALTFCVDLNRSIKAYLLTDGGGDGGDYDDDGDDDDDDDDEISNSRNSL